ncbi:MAG: hypothetical protein WCJ30_20710, partial [Deltaproteobacteria bacterium]
MTGFVSGGYYVVRYATRGEGSMSPTLLPPRFVTTSNCLAVHAIDTWTFAWTGDEPAARRKNAATLGWDDDTLAQVTAWCTATFDEGSTGYPDVFLAVDDALRFVERFLAARDDVLVIGLALDEPSAAAFVAEFAPAPGMGEQGASVALRANREPAPGGEVLGFDVLGWEAGGCHSFVCNGLERVFEDKLGARPNASGLYDDETEAARCAELAGSPGVGAEPA